MPRKLLKFLIVILLPFLTNGEGSSLLDMSQVLWNKLVNGSLSNLGSLDPLVIPTVKVDQSEGHTRYRMILTNVQVLGLNESSLESVKIGKGRVRANLTDTEAGYVSYNEGGRLDAIRYRFHTVVKELKPLSSEQLRVTPIEEANGEQQRTFQKYQQKNFQNFELSHDQIEAQGSDRATGVRVEVHADESFEEIPQTSAKITIYDDEEQRPLRSGQAEPQSPEKSAKIRVYADESQQESPDAQKSAKIRIYAGESHRTLKDPLYTGHRAQGRPVYYEDNAKPQFYFVHQQAPYDYPQYPEQHSQNYPQNGGFSGNRGYEVVEPSSEPYREQPDDADNDNNYYEHFESHRLPGSRRFDYRAHEGKGRPQVQGTYQGREGSRGVAAFEPSNQVTTETNNFGDKVSKPYAHQTQAQVTTERSSERGGDVDAVDQYVNGEVRPRPENPAQRAHPTRKVQVSEQTVGPEKFNPPGPAVKSIRVNPTTGLPIYPVYVSRESPTSPKFGDNAKFDGTRNVYLSHDRNSKKTSDEGQINEPDCNKGEFGCVYRRPTTPLAISEENSSRDSGEAVEETIRLETQARLDPHVRPRPVKASFHVNKERLRVNTLETSDGRYAEGVDEGRGSGRRSDRLEGQPGYIDIVYVDKKGGKNCSCQRVREFGNLRIAPGRDIIVYSLNDLVRDLNNSGRFIIHNFTESESLSKKNNLSRIAEESRRIEDMIRYAKNHQETEGYSEEDTEIIYHYGSNNASGNFTEIPRKKRAHDEENDDDIMHIVVRIRSPSLRVKAGYLLMGKVGDQVVQGEGKLDAKFTELIGDFTIELRKVAENTLIVRAARARLEAADKDISLEGIDMEGPVAEVFDQGLTAAEAVAAMLADDLATKALNEEAGESIIYRMFRDLPK